MYLSDIKKLNIEERGSYDVIVAGGGPAGFAAAVCAARAGAKTLLIEQTSCVGGIATAGLMSHWTGDIDSKLFREVIERCNDKRDNPYVPEPEYRRFIDTERLKLVFLEMLTEAGAEILFYTFLSDVVTVDGAVKGVITENKSGRGFYSASVVIDATGDGDAAYKAGAEFCNGRETDGKKQPATLMFKVGGVNDDKAVLLGSFESLYETPKGELQALAKRELPHPAGHVLLYYNPLPGVVTVNMTNCIDVDGTKTEDVTKAEIVCRKQMYSIVDFLRKYVPGFENCYALTSASLMGIRETRHFKGKYTLTETDIYTARQFPDWIARGAYFNFDVHGMSGAGLDKTGVQKKFEQVNGYTVPYGCLVPEKTEGLLLAGRCISGTHLAHSNYRAMPICLAMGEGAGYAAAIAVKEKILPSAVDVKKIQNYLI